MRPLAPQTTLAPKEVRRMKLTWKDAAATGLAALAVAVFFAGHEGWDVWLVGSSYRWGIAAVALLGIAACALGSPSKGPASRLLAVLGGLAFVLAIAGLVSGSLTLFSLLVVDIVALWLGSTIRHAGGVSDRRTSARAA
jgi:hypothetical protein